MRVGILCKNKTMAHGIMYVDILNNRLLEESLFSQRFYWQSDKMFHGYFQSSVTTKIIYIALNENK